jgi:hypothetical protein
MNDLSRALALAMIGLAMLQAGRARAGDLVRSQPAVDSEWRETVETLQPRLAFFLSGFEQCLFGAESAEALDGCQKLARKAKSLSDGILDATRTAQVSRALVAAREKTRATCEALSSGLESFLRFLASRDEQALGEVTSQLAAAHQLQLEASAEMEKVHSGTAPGRDDPVAPRLAARGAP